MPNVTITINTPTLIAGESFKVRYRELPSGIFSAPQTETNAPFTLTGLTSGDYELEIIVVKDDIECPATFQYFTVFEPYECVEFSAVIVQSGSLYNVEITYPTIVTNPPCGYLIQIIGLVNNKSLTYVTLPVSPLIIPISYESVLIRVIANMCDGKYLTCYEADLTAPAPACTQIVVIDTSVVLLAQNPPSKTFLVNFFITQSTPPTTAMIVNIVQANTYIISGVPGQTSFGPFNPFPLTPTQTSFSIQVATTAIVLNKQYSFDYSLIDVCGKKHTGTVYIQL